MKNTVKKILALVFVVAMVCSLAVPAFAAEDYIKEVTVKFIDADGKVVKVDIAEGDKLATSKATLQSVLKKADDKTTAISLTFKKGAIDEINGKTANEAAGTVKMDNSKWAVALNGKTVSGDLSTISVSKKDNVVVYLYNETFKTQLVQLDKSAIAQGIISFYYYDAAGNKQPVVGATVTLTGISDLTKFVETVVVAETKAVGETNEYGLPAGNVYSSTFKTDEKGQIWIAPQYLADGAKFKVESVDVVDASTLSSKKDFEKIGLKMDDHKAEYNANISRTGEDGAIQGTEIKTADMYYTAGATGDMTVVYVMVAAVAVITLGAVVIMKKKSVKDN